jgi:quinol-cytochrome oxidoreductase complex cytochrome b subunit
MKFIKLRERISAIKSKDFGKGFSKKIDSRIRAITSGLSFKELRALFRGDPPTERPNPRYRFQIISFIAHIRPKTYMKATTKFNHTFRLGWLTMFFFVVCSITGVILMVYYTPHPSIAYDSILNIESGVWFGELLRDLHRITAEAMVIFCWLHLFRTYFTGSYKHGRSFTWLTGVILLLITSWLSFSGYLLPWDQLSYWAVTVGTSVTDSAPMLGPEINILMRGALDIGAGGLLRFYLQHVALFPFLALLMVGVHYYRVAREHGISLPAAVEEGDLSPLDTKAPWYFWWLQGMLKIDPAKIFETLFGYVGINLNLGTLFDSKVIMGLILPPLFVLILAAIPYVDRNPYRLAKKRPFAIFWGILWIVVLVILSYMGTPLYGIETPPATRIVQDLAPEEGEGSLYLIPYEELQQGIYYVGEDYGSDLCPDLVYQPEPDLDPNTIINGCPSLTAVFIEFSERLKDAESNGELPNLEGALVIEDWQNDLKKITPHIEWTSPESNEWQVYEMHYYLHKDRDRSD